jgi:hypothetical protein
VIDTETRWEQARWLVRDDSLKPEDRLAGLLVLLYAQQILRLASENDIAVHMIARRDEENGKLAEAEDG